MSPTTGVDPVEGWLLPRGLATPEGSAWTRIGTLDGTQRAYVDEAGLVSPGHGRPSIDWWIGADDRWHVPARETAVRQSLVRATPVVETAMRIPGGDALHRACVVRLASGEGGGDAVLIEVENRSGVPFALALALRPFDTRGAVPVGSVCLEGTAIVADERTALALPKPPNRALAGRGGDGDPLALVTSGGADGAQFEALEDPDGLAHAVVIVPVPHTATYRAVIPLDAAMREFPSVLPSAADVAEGWRVQLRDVARLVVPDPGRSAAADVLPANLLLAAADSAEAPVEARVALADALDTVGFGETASELLVGALVEVEGAATSATGDAAAEQAVAAGLGRHLQRGGEVVLAPSGVEVAARAAQRLAAGLRPRRLRRGRERAVPTVETVADLEALAVVLELGGEGRAAQDVRSITAGLADDAREATAEPVAARLDALLASSTATASWPGARGWVAAAEAANLLFASVVRVRAHEVIVLPEVPEAWLGQNLEVHAVRTTAGVVSFAVRWHDERPALLWEVVGAPGPLTLRAPGLDATWSTDEPKGEALLAPVPLAAKPAGGVTIGGLQIGRRAASPSPDPDPPA